MAIGANVMACSDTLLTFLQLGAGVTIVSVDTAIPSPLALYTCVFGEGYELPELPGWPGVDAICFTDRTDLEPKGWTVRTVRPLLPADLPRSSRDAKIRPHRWLPDHDASLYIDPSVELLVSPHEVWNALITEDNVVLGAMVHSFRDTVLDEFVAVYRSNYDQHVTLTEHLTAYQLTDPDGLELKPIWGGVLARRHHDPRCVEAMEDWFAQVMRYSRRDQLSLPGVVTRAPDGAISLHELDNRESSFHRWPRDDYSKPESYTDNVRRALLPPVIAEIAEHRRRIDAEHKLSEALRDRDEAVAARKAAEVEARESTAKAAETAERLRATEGRLDAVLSSRTWRSTSWVRRLRTGGRVT